MARYIHDLKSILIRISLAATCILPSVGFSEIYKQTQPDGTVIFTDQPKEGQSHEKVKVQPTATIPALDTRGIRQTAQKASTPIEYKVSISSPGHERHYHNANADAIPVGVSVAPHPKHGTTVSVTVNGKTIDPNVSVLPIMYRGEHTISVKVLSRSGKTVASASNTFFVHRSSGKH